LQIIFFAGIGFLLQLQISAQQRPNMTVVFATVEKALIEMPN
jgi:hypothetical protein